MLILVVEDHPTTLCLYRWYFKAIGIDIHCESSVAEALHVLTEKQFDAVITDRLLKAGDDQSSKGEEVVTAVRELQPGVPVIMVSDREGPTAADGFIWKRDPDFPGCLIGKIIEAAKWQFASAIIWRVCHELNNVTMIIEGEAEILKNSIITSQRLTEDLCETILGTLNLITKETRRLANFSKFLARSGAKRTLEVSREGGAAMVWMREVDEK